MDSRGTGGAGASVAKQLTRVFVEAYGKTPLAYLTMLHVERMARLLREDKLSVAAALEGRSVGPNTSTQRDPPSPVGNLLVGLRLHNMNRHDTIHGPSISVSPLQSKVVDSRLSCRDAALDAIERLQQRTGVTASARRDIVADVHCAGLGFERQTIYRCIRRVTGYELAALSRS